MATVSETSGAKTQLGSGLADGVNTLSGNETVTFNLYVKLVLPKDGYVFWVNATLVNDSAIYNALTYGFGEFNNPGNFPLPSRTLTVKGSFHYNTEMHQLEDRVTAYNHILFTAESPVTDLNLVGPSLIYIGNYQGQQFGFSRRENYYKQADLYHYRADALYSVMQSQIIDTMAGFDINNLIVSNSLPIWLTFNNYFTIYPSFLALQNLAPPFATAHIEPSDTEALAQIPFIDQQSNPWLLTKDRVRLTLYGVDNNTALNFQNYVYNYITNNDSVMGLMNMPVMRDEKMTQPEFGIIAEKKTIIFDVSYHQTTINNVAMQYILSAFCSFNVVSP
jgi:hypothetical protein